MQVCSHYAVMKPGAYCDIHNCREHMFVEKNYVSFHQRLQINEVNRTKLVTDFPCPFTIQLYSECDFLYFTFQSFFQAAHWLPGVRLQNLPWSKTGLVSRQVLHPLSKLQNCIWSKTGRYKTGLVSNTKIEASLRATKPKPWQSNLTSDTVEIFIQNEKAGLVPMQSRFRSRR